MSDSSDDGGWKFALDEVGPEAEREADDPERAIEPESVNPEHALFVALGVVGAVLVVVAVL